MATCVIAYRRASAGPGPSGEMHAASAALPALAFHAETASVAFAGAVCRAPADALTAAATSAAIKSTSGTRLRTCMIHLLS